MAKVPNGVESLSKISIASRAHERYWRTTDSMQTTQHLLPLYQSNVVIKNEENHIGVKNNQS